ncbi:MAG: WD40 repeat domain-containing protein [Planctomycetota bacterium]
MDAAVRSVAFSPDGTELAAGLGDGSVTLLSLPEGEEKRRWHALTKRVTSVTFSPEADYLLAADVSEMALWRTATGERVERDEFRGESPAAFSPGGDFLAAARSDEGVLVWRFPAGYVVRTLPCPTRGLLLAFSPRDGLLATADESETVSLWRLGDGESPARFAASEQALEALAFSPDSRLIATGGVDRAVRLWDAGTRAQLAELAGHERRVMALAFSPDCRLLATGGNDFTVRLWGVPGSAEGTALPLETRPRKRETGMDEASAPPHRPKPRD